MTEPRIDHPTFIEAEEPQHLEVSAGCRKAPAATGHSGTHATENRIYQVAMLIAALLLLATAV
ncbi:MAG TPA: hypothetical protein VGD59_04475 [Acidisarcina sp.]